MRAKLHARILLSVVGRGSGKWAKAKQGIEMSCLKSEDDSVRLWEKRRRDEGEDSEGGGSEGGRKGKGKEKDSRARDIR